MTTKTLPGSSGFPVVGETHSFLRDLHTFVSTRVRHYGPVFRTHLLSLPTIISTSYTTTLQILTSTPSNSHFQAAPAYAEFLGQIYPTANLLTASDNTPARQIPLRFLPALNGAALAHYTNTIDNIIQTHLDDLATAIQKSANGQVTICPYAFFKCLSEQIITSIVLGKLPPELYRRVRQCCSEHFNAVVAMPVSVNMFGMQSARAKGLLGYRQLVVIIERVVEDRIHWCIEGQGSVECVLDVVLRGLKREGECANVGEFKGHLVEFLLVLLSTAIPKCLASGMTSVLKEGIGNKQTGELLKKGGDEIGWVLMETLRMWPPLMGGMRMSSEGGEIGGHQVNGVWRVWYSIWHCNRDEQVFERAEEFWAERWKGRLRGTGCPFSGDVEGDLPVSFGAGERMCAGREMGWLVLSKVVEMFFSRFCVENGKDGQDGQGVALMRFFPVVREKNDSEVTVRLRGCV